MNYSRKIRENSEVISFDRPRSIDECDRRVSFRGMESTPNRRLADDSWAELLGEVRPAPSLYYADGFWNFGEDKQAARAKREKNVWENDSPTKVGRFPKRPVGFKN